ncbi:DUF2628 domain-containing protein [Plastoroseomonas hellenica]|uniref:DUF2628 domain-containing protein n=1 Tax=Plastoroseomonas hellenica TaxID=2687306 RepID=A0ABS5EXR2_9PROT|nr:DUF2628 domain-containing protein [Plastoroseomonas hellenica]MBR0643149.1 DUF2628 domain-containing protein [Plastoroseomonas hellenica]MBR0665081.1 DUF2628 domain-containing protein [Plastoroseomonas hellenica]
MRAFTLHAAPGHQPLLIPEGFSWGAFVFAPFWLLRHGLWLGLLAYVAGFAAIALAAPPGWRSLGLLALHLLAGFEARDLLRAKLARRGRDVRAVIFGMDEDAALLRALSQDEALRAEAARAVQGGRA